MACQENIWSLFEQVGLGHLMVEAVGGVVEALVGKKVDVGAAFGFIYLGNLKEGNVEVRVEVHEEEKTEGGRTQQSKHSGGGEKEKGRKVLLVVVRVSDLDQI